MYVTVLYYNNFY